MAIGDKYRRPQREKREKPADKQRKQRSALADVVTREYTIHLHKHVHSIGFKHRAPTAVKAVCKFARQHMGTKDVRLDPNCNRAIWRRGIKDVPRRLRIRLARKRNDDEGAKEMLYTYVTVVDSYQTPAQFRGVSTVVVEQDE